MTYIGGGVEKVQDYEIIEKIAETRGSVIYRATKEGSDHTVILKTLKAKFPTPSEIARFRQEYKRIKNIRADNIVEIIDIVGYKGSFALVLEDFDGVSLKTLITEKSKFDIKSFLEASIQIAEILAHLHNEEIVHRDIKPHNILANTATGQLKLTDFGISIDFTHENDQVYHSEVVSGTLPYMSPEQTGRMNRTIDYRTDLYSLGITFYEMLTGCLPFVSDDPLKIFHSHIAIMPAPPKDIDSDIPEVISDIVMKLMSKNTEDRYQNGFGLAADLKQCLRQLDHSGKIERFELAQNDISNRFIIPQKIFGREKEAEALVSGFEKLCDLPESFVGQDGHHGVRIMVVAGEPGIGKSALINEIHKAIVAGRGYFASGKYEQFGKDKPYSALIQAFQSIVKQILSENEERIKIWKEKILEACGVNGKIVTDVIPGLQHIIGQQPELAQLDPESTRNRFKYVFANVASVFAAADHPLALFIDDLQWADLPSIQMIHDLVTGGTLQYAYLIGAYRSDEVDMTHPLAEMITAVKDTGVSVSWINLGPVTSNDIKNIIKNFLKCGEEKAQPLADLIHEKTGGNPFFVIQFLETLYNEKQITLDAENGWQWDLGTIKSMQMTDNIVDLMVHKIGKLPDNVREVLTVCAAIGNRFDLETLAFILEKTIDETLEDLTAAMEEGFLGFSAQKELYVFHHDRIQEAAYSMVPDSEKPALHTRIGRRELEKAAEQGSFEKRLFYIADQLNQGASLITNAKEREKLARLNLKAGKKAKTSSAFSPAILYFATGLKLLENNYWEQQYELALSLYEEIAEAAFLNGDYERMDELLDAALPHTKTELDKARLIIIKVYASAAQEDFQGAIDAGVPMLRRLSIKFQSKPTIIRVGIELIKLKMLLLTKKDEDILNFPEMRDPRALACMQILAGLGYAGFFVNPNIFALDVIKPCRLALKYGNGPDNGFGFMGYAILILAGMWDFNGGIRFGKLGLKIIEKQDVRRQFPRINFVYYSFLLHWKAPLEGTVKPLLEGYRVGMETGDFDYASFNLLMSDVHALFAGKELSEQCQDMEKHNHIIREFKKKSVLTMHSTVWQVSLNLYGQCDNPLMLTGKAIEGEKMLDTWVAEKNNIALAVFYIARLCVRVVYGEYEMALEDSKEFKKYKDAMQGLVTNQFAVLSDFVARALLYENASFFEKIKHRVFMRVNQIKLKVWAKNSPEDCLPMVQMVKALRIAHIRKNKKSAIKKFQETIKLCKRPGNIIVEAISSELLAEAYIAEGDTEKAKEAITDAYSVFSVWGAMAKLDMLKNKHPDLLAEQLQADANRGGALTDSSTETMPDFLDLSTAMKASQTISREIVLEKLLVKMIEITMENAGADKGLILLADNGRLLIEAERTVGSNEVEVLRSIPLDSYDGISSNIVNYVARTEETLILSDAAVEGAFKNDLYVVTNRPKSILCVPILHRKKLLGILYLENNLSAGAFTPERLELLDVISSQIAISIDNARLYESLEAKVKERTRELQDALDYQKQIEKKLRQLTVTDELTGMFNRRYLEDTLSKEFEECQRYQNGLSCLMMDLDHFKRANDIYGHGFGDFVLREFCDRLRASIRNVDMGFRYGGEEFTVLLPQTSYEEAKPVAERILRACREKKFENREHSLAVTVSIGLACCNRHNPQNPEELISIADKNLYEAKESGRDRWHG